MLFAWSPAQPARQGNFFDGVPNLESSKDSHKAFHASVMDAWNPKWRPNTAPTSTSKQAPRCPSTQVNTGPSGEVAGMHESKLFATHQMQQKTLLSEKRAANSRRPQTSPVVGSQGLLSQQRDGVGRRVGLRTRATERKQPCGGFTKRPSTSPAVGGQRKQSSLEKRLAEAGAGSRRSSRSSVRATDHELGAGAVPHPSAPSKQTGKRPPSAAKPGGLASLLATEGLPHCYRKAMYVGDDLRQCYTFHPEVPKKQGEFVGDHEMNSATPHGTINNAHGSVMPHGRSHQVPGGSHAYIAPTSCQRCDEMHENGKAAALGFDRPPAASKQGNGWSALCVAASEGDISRLLELVQLGHDVNHETRYGDTALLVAAGQDKVSSISALIQCGVNLFHETRYGETPLIKAATSGSLNAVKTLIQCGMRPDYETQHGNTALVRVCDTDEQIDSARLLIELGASVNLETKCGITPLIAAASGGGVETAQMLIREAKCETNYETDFSAETAIMKAAANNQLEVLAAIRALGGDLNYKSKHGETALSRAAKSGALRTVSDLLDQGALPEFEDSSGLSPLGHAAAASQIYTVKLMVSKNCDINREMASGDTPLMLAARASDMEMIQVNHCAGLNIQTADAA